MHDKIKSFWKKVGEISLETLGFVKLRLGAGVTLGFTKYKGALISLEVKGLVKFYFWVRYARSFARHQRVRDISLETEA
jgi:hypothetical protein